MPNPPSQLGFSMTLLFSFLFLNLKNIVKILKK